MEIVLLFVGLDGIWTLVWGVNSAMGIVKSALVELLVTANYVMPLKFCIMECALQIVQMGTIKIRMNVNSAQ